jgi:hypothetical protein
MAALQGGTGERDWYLDLLMRRLYRGWCLVGYDRRVVLLSRMYTLEFSGLAGTKVVSYTPDISEKDTLLLRNEAVARRTVADIGTVTVVAPRPEDTAGTVVAVRAPDGGVLIIPSSKMPQSMPTPVCQ